MLEPAVLPEPERPKAPEESVEAPDVFALVVSTAVELVVVLTLLF